jgi:3-hydroxyacyl-[acyl-carrier-protein] dehydratase
MSLLTDEPIIIAERREGDGIELELELPPDFRYFAGHFPGFPILPGVVHIHLAMMLARRHLALGGRMAAAMQVKFRKPIWPNSRLLLALRLEARAGQEVLTFALSCEGEPCSSGKITLGR